MLSQSFFKHTSIDEFSIINLEQNQIYFNHHSNFNDPFDMTHEINIENISDSVLIKLYKNSYSNPELTEKLLNDSINKNELITFFKENIDTFSEPNTPINVKHEFLNEILKIKNSYELKKTTTIIKEGILTKTQPYINQRINDLKISISNMGISCFTKQNDNLLMWAHYTDKHKGICLEFDSSDPLFINPYEVKYELKIPKINSDFICSNDIRFKYTEEFVCYKSKDWEYEKEYRVFKEEYNKAYHYKPSNLKAIYFGLKTNDDDIQKIRSIVKSKNPNIIFYKMEKKKGLFEIERKRIN